jgi:hypothetical protein
MNFSLATTHLYRLFRYGAHDRNRTGDLVLTKDVLYRLSYVGPGPPDWSGWWESNPRHQLGRLRFYH